MVVGKKCAMTHSLSSSGSNFEFRRGENNFPAVYFGCRDSLKVREDNLTSYCGRCDVSSDQWWHSEIFLSDADLKKKKKNRNDDAIHKKL